MKNKGFGRTTTGEVRAINEDSVLFDDERALYIVADGVGGLAQGDRASTLAVEVCSQELSRAASNRALWKVPDDELAGWLRDAVQRASRAVHEEATSGGWRDGDEEELGGRRMATTLTVLWLAGTRAVVCHVGDSRAYHWRRGVLRQITADHTVAEELLRAGVLEPEDIATHPYRSVLSRSVGGRDEVEPDTLVFDTEAGDRFLLCTDGLTRYVTQTAWLADILASEDPEAAIDKLIRHALESGGADNVTALVVVTDDTTRKTSAARARTSVWTKVRRALGGD